MILADFWHKLICDWVWLEIDEDMDDEELNNELVQWGAVKELGKVGVEGADLVQVIRSLEKKRKEKRA